MLVHTTISAEGGLGRWAIHSLCETEYHHISQPQFKVMHHDVTSAKKTTLSDSDYMRAEQGVAVFEVAPILQLSILPSLTPHCGLD